MSGALISIAIASQVCADRIAFDYSGCMPLPRAMYALRGQLRNMNPFLLESVAVDDSRILSRALACVMDNRRQVDSVTLRSLVTLRNGV